MAPRLRKAVGTVLLLTFLAAYAVFAVAIAMGRIAEASMPVQFVFYAAIGLLWVLPAGLLIRWNDRDEPRQAAFTRLKRLLSAKGAPVRNALV